MTSWNSKCLSNNLRGVCKNTRTVKIHENTLCQYPGWIYPEEFPGKNLVRKTIPGWKAFGVFHLPDNITQLSSLQGKYRIISNTQWIFDFDPDKFWYYPCDITQSLVCASVSLGSQQSVVVFPGNIRLNLFVIKDWFLLVFTDFLWWAENWMLSNRTFVNQNSLNEGFPCDNLGLARLSYANIFQLLTVRYVD